MHAASERQLPNVGPPDKGIRLADSQVTHSAIFRNSLARKDLTKRRNFVKKSTQSRGTVG